MKRPSVNPSAPQARTFEDLTQTYQEYAGRYLNICDETINEQKIYLERFFRYLGFQLPPSLSPDDLQGFLFEYAQKHGPGSRKWMHTTLRSFLRFCFYWNYLKCDLSVAVPAVRIRRLAGVPKAIESSSIQKLLDSIDLDTPIGIRDYAIIQILSSYGIRGIQARCLRLQDIEWRSNQIRFQAFKLGKPVVQHLTEEVGNSLFTYIHSARPTCTEYGEVFLTSRPPFRSFNSSGTLSGIISRRLKAAGITLPEGTSHGTHSFRHAFATRLLAGNTPFKLIADMLGHRDPASTYLYSKVDFNNLSQAAMEWPEVHP